LATATLAGGSHSVRAVYSGDAFYASSTSAAFSQTVTKVGSTATVPGPLSASTLGSAVTFTATLAKAGTGAFPTGNVEFLRGTAVIGSGAINPATGQATLTTSALAGGSHSITVRYPGDVNYAGSTSPAITQTVNRPTATPTVASSSSSSTYGQSVTLTSRVTGVVNMATPTGTVQFYDGTALLGTGTISLVGGVATATLATAAISGGTRSITARYVPATTDTNYATATSAAISQTVARVAVTTTLALTTGTPDRYTATVTGVVGGRVPTGSVQFRDRGVNIFAPVPLDATGKASFTSSGLTALAVGSHSITAVYVPAKAEANYIAGAVSSPVNRTVLAAGTAASTTTLASSSPTATVGQNVTLTATVAVAPGAVAPTGGIVEFWDGSTYLGRGSLVAVNGAFRATFNTIFFARGTRSITARFVGNATSAASASGILSQSIV
jgi:hypothetical protein